MSASVANDVVRFWKEAGPAQWFAKNEAFDRHFRERFLQPHLAVARREHDHWIDDPIGALALMVLLDQFPRNAFRGTAHMYATDPLARHFARQALTAGHVAHWTAADPDLALFFCLPFAHSEDPTDQDLSVTLNGRLGPTWLAHAQDHRAIIRRFNRFPHRNPLLLRETTEAEARFLDSGGFAG